MSQTCYYEILGISRQSSEEEIKKAYRQMALKYHPERNPGDNEAEQRFKECAEAYEVLKKKKKRNLYDRFGHAGLGNSSGGHPFNSAEDIFSHFSDIFGDIFGFSMGGSASRANRPQQGASLRYNQKLSFRQAAKGDTIKINIYRIIQECINNILKHANATKVYITLEADEEYIHGLIEDNGHGFDIHAAKKKGIGIDNICTRIHFLKGKVDITSNPGNGALIAFHIPME